jgi:hypothetical protein
MPGAWIYDFKSGGRILVPAPGHSGDGANQAGRSFNTLIVDDWRRCEEKGDAIARQLIERVRKPTWNQNHPIWENHIHFKGHAEDPGHKSHPRVKRMRQAIYDGSLRECIYSFCYRDISHKRRRDGVRWSKLIRQDKLIRSQRVNLPADRFHCQILGISARSGSSYYPAAILDRCRVPGLDPMIARDPQFPDDVFVLGFDVAPGASARADSSAAFVYRVREVDAEKLAAEMSINGQPVSASWIDEKFGAWEIAAVFAHTLKNKDARETSGFLHWLHARFGFAMVVLDFGAGGGGWWVFQELRKSKQIYNGLEFTVIPWAESHESASADKLPIVHAFKRDSEKQKTKIGQLSFIHQTCRSSDNGFLFAFHLRYQGAWYAMQIRYPLALEDRTDPVVEAWEPDKKQAMQTLDKGLQQLAKVNQLTNADGSAKTGRGGASFPMFRAVGKKDIAIASLQAFAGVMAYIEGDEEAREIEAEVFFS